MPHKPPIPAFAYLRVSGKGQLDGDGFPRQRVTIQEYARLNNIEIVREFEERAVCGENDLADRPAMMDMAASLNGVRTIVIEKLDRLARDLFVQEGLIRELQKRGITLISAKEPDLLDSDPTRKFCRQVLGAVSELEKSMLVSKLRSARDRIRVRAGRCEGVKPYGAHPRYPGEKQTLERMRQARVTGLSYSDIARLLNSEGTRARLGGEWSASRVSSALRKRYGA